MDRDRVRISRLFGSRDIALGQTMAVTPVKDGVERVGIQLRLSAGETIPLRRAGLVHFGSLLEILRRRGRLRPGSFSRGLQERPNAPPVAMFGAGTLLDRTYAPLLAFLAPRNVSGSPTNAEI